MVVIIVDSTVAAQVEEPTTSSDARDSILHTSTGEPNIVKSALVVVTPESATDIVPEVLVMTLALSESAANTVHTIIVMGSESASVELVQPWTS